MTETSAPTTPVEAVSPPARQPFPRFWQAALLCALVLVLAFGVVIVLVASAAFVVALTGGNPSRLSQDLQVALMGVSNLVAFLLVLVVSVVWSGEELGRLFPFRRVRLVLLLPMALTVAGLHLLLSDLDNLTRMLLPMPEFISEVFRSIGSGTWAGVFTVIVVAPLTEELFFRGVILNGFLRNYRVGSAVLLSALLFAFIHLNPWQLASALVLGVVLAWWLIRTASLWPCLFGHAVMNGLAVVGPFLPVQIAGYNDFSQLSFQPWWLDATGAALALTGILWLRGIFRNGRCYHSPGQQE